MTAKKRALAASVATIGLGGAVMAPQPAGAHETPPLHLLDATADVNSTHTQIKVCNLTYDRLAQGRWIRGDGSLGVSIPVLYGNCVSYSEGAIDQFRVCIIDYGCTGWKVP